MSSEGYLGIDIGSVSTNLVVINRIEGKINVAGSVYRRTEADPINATKRGLTELKKQLPEDIKIKGVGTTGSGRKLIGLIVGADIVKNEITAHAKGTRNIVPDVQTILEIGGQDSKIIILRDGSVNRFAMNTVCAAGTGSFLDHQAARLGIPIEKFGDYAIKAENGAEIAGRCTVFAESDMISKQQKGTPKDEITYGLCKSLVRNYLGNVAKGLEIQGPIVFQGGVAANQGIKRAFEEALGEEIIIPPYYEVMGAIGIAIIVEKYIESNKITTGFKGFNIVTFDYTISTFNDKGCENNCEITIVKKGSEKLGYMGGRCGKWENKILEDNTSEDVITIKNTSKNTSDKNCTTCMDT